MSDFNKNNILIGGATLVVDEAHLGYTRGGVTLAKDGDFLEVTPDQRTYPVITQKTTESYQVSTELLEATLANIKLAWGEGADVEGAGTTLKLGTADVDVSEHELVFNGVSPKNEAGAYGDRTITFHRAVAMEYGDMAHQRDEETVVPVTFTCLFSEEETEVGNIEDAAAS